MFRTESVDVTDSSCADRDAIRLSLISFICDCRFSNFSLWQEVTPPHQENGRNGDEQYLFFHIDMILCMIMLFRETYMARL